MGSSESFSQQLDATKTLDERLHAGTASRPERTRSMPAGLHPAATSGEEQQIRSRPIETRSRRVSDAVRERVPILNRVSERVLVLLAVGTLVWLIAVTAALAWVLLVRTAAPAVEAPDEAAVIVEKIHARGRAMQRKLLRIPLLSAVYVIIAPYTGVLMGLAGPQVRLAFRWLNGIIPALRKAQGFYVVVFWFNKIKQAQLLTMLSTVLRSTWLKAGDSLRGCVQPAAGDAAVTVATAGRAGL